MIQIEIKNMYAHQNKLQGLLDNRALRTAGAVALVTLALAGTIVMPSAAPRVARALYKLYRYKRMRSARVLANNNAKRALYYLKRTGVIRFHKTGGELLCSLTKLGRKRMERLSFEKMYIPKPVKWNWRWWLVAADIPTKDYERAAEALRYKLLQVGFKALQRTLWIHPYDPREQLQEIVKHYHVAHFVTVMEISRLDKYDEKLLRSHFRKRGVL